MLNVDMLACRLREQLPGLELLFEEPMSRHTTFKVGGPAALMARPKSEEEAVAAVRVARELGIEPIFVGNGSNLLVDDRGLDAFVIVTTPGLARCERDGERIIGGCGTVLAALANEAARASLTGLEFAHGIPGTLGGAVTMNAGAYDGEMRQVVEWVRVLNENGEVEVLSGEQCEFSYRHSLFSNRNCLILAACLRLRQGDEEQIRARMAELMSRRKEKQPLEFPSAGSTFKRPEGYFAAALIDQCGLKGHAVGGAQVSPKHAGFVVNTGTATCQDILDLMDEVKASVYQATGVTLEPEVKYLK